MVCETCRFEMVERMATDESPYRYDLAGGWLLSGIVVYRCPKCKSEAPLIPKIVQLHRLMANVLVQKPGPLAGSEIKFLRKNAGFPAKDFAALIGVTPSYLSRVENGAPKHESFGPSVDKLARLLGTEGTDAVEGLKKLAGLQKKKRRLERKFRLVRGKGWRAAA